MDILDIDEVLKDDSFIFLEEKAQDDVANILQQWKTNNQIGSQDQGFKLNTRTFTRPKRKPAQSLEAQFNTQQPDGINLQIGGLVTSMQKSFIQDTSPPASICSSMDFSMDRMKNSLITSADFSNVSFMEENDNDNYDDQLFPKPQSDFDYSINDLIRDRKALESLTMSGESTIIKDSNIAQIDDMSLLSTSTMNNSTDSISAGVITSETASPLNQTKVIESQPQNVTFDATVPQKIEGNDDDFIANTTFNFVDSIQVPNGTYIENGHVDSNNMEPAINGTFKKIALNETIDLNGSMDVVHHGTPDNSLAKASTLYYEQSTPHHAASSVRANLKYTPTIKNVIDEVNISPITSKDSAFNATFEKVRNQTFGEDDIRLNRTQDCIEAINHLIPDVDANDIDDKDIGADLWEASEKDEQEFSHMLESFGKYTPTDKSIKIQKSVDDIKKKYSVAAETKPTCGQVTTGTSPAALTTSFSRLLNRRSRLYDEISLNMSTKSLSLKESESPNEKEENTAEENNKTDQTECVEESPSLHHPRMKNMKRDRDRFKTMRIVKRDDEKSSLNVPCIDDELGPEDASNETQRFSRIDNNSTTVFNNNTHEIDTYATYRKPKESKLQMKSIAPMMQQTQILSQPTMLAAGGHQRSISRPRYIGGLQKFSYTSKDMAKASSVDDLEKSKTTSEESLNIAPKLSLLSKPSASGVVSPMGTKAKSFHNLSNNFGYTMTKKTAAGMSTALKTSESSLSSASSRSSDVAEKTKSDQNVFKVPTSTISALRRPAAAAATSGANSATARKGMVRPSSGCFGFSSGSSTKLDGHSGSEHTSRMNTTAPGPPAYNSKLNTVGNSTLPAKTTSIPKPSGLRPPSTTGIKRSALPRPSSLVRR